MRTICFLIAAIVAISSASYADTSAEAKRDAALKGINVCLRRNEVSSKECRDLNKNIQTLTEVYRQGDKTVLPMLLRFTYLTEFFDEALVTDPDGFLTIMGSLPEANQQSVASGLSGGVFGLPRPRFEAVRATLRDVPDSSPNRELAKKCLTVLETNNASFLLDYFPAGTFTGLASEFQVRAYSRELYALGEKPLWSAEADEGLTYRLTVLPAFFAPESVTLVVLPDGTGRVRFRTTDPHRLHPVADDLHEVSPHQIANFSVEFNRSNFWQLPTEPSRRGFDGADWILETHQNGRYHVVVRWCPSKTQFGRMGRDLFDLTGHKSHGGC